MNNLTIEDLFAVTLDEPTQERTTYTAAQVKAYWAELGLKTTDMFKETKSMLVKSLLKLSSNGTDCDKCDGKGTWFFIKGNKDMPCGKCAGKGYTTAIDDQRGEKYNHRKSSGLVMDTTFASFA